MSQPMRFFALIPIATGIGLWRMEMWGWWLAVVTQGLGIAGALLNTCSYILAGFSGNDSPAYAFGGLFGAIVVLAINGSILYWFIKNRQLFEGQPNMVMGPDGQMIDKPSNANNIAITLGIIGGGAVVLILVSVAVIAVLALLGPQIGTTFSTIRDSLSTPMP